MMPNRLDLLEALILVTPLISIMLTCVQSSSGVFSSVSHLRILQMKEIQLYNELKNCCYQKLDTSNFNNKKTQTIDSNSCDQKLIDSESIFELKIQSTTNLELNTDLIVQSIIDSVDKQVPKKLLENQFYSDCFEQDIAQVYRYAAKEDSIVAKFLNHPNNVYLLLRRATYLWSKLFSVQNLSPNFSSLIEQYNQAKYILWPDQADIAGANEALERLRQFTHIPVTSFISACIEGQLNYHQPIQTGTNSQLAYNCQFEQEIYDRDTVDNRLGADLCLEIGKQAFNNGSYYGAIEWLTAAITESNFNKLNPSSSHSKTVQNDNLNKLTTNFTTQSNNSSEYFDKVVNEEKLKNLTKMTEFESTNYNQTRLNRNQTIESLNYLSWSYFRVNDLEAAIKYAKKLIEIDPKEPRWLSDTVYMEYTRETGIKNNQEYKKSNSNQQFNLVGSYISEYKLGLLKTLVSNRHSEKSRMSEAEILLITEFLDSYCGLKFSSDFDSVEKCVNALIDIKLHNLALLNKLTDLESFLKNDNNRNYIQQLLLDRNNNGTEMLNFEIEISKYVCRNGYLYAQNSNPATTYSFSDTFKDELMCFLEFGYNRELGDSTNYPLWGPYKIEQIHRSPDVFIWHDFINDDEISQLNEMSIIQLNRAVIHNPKSGQLEPANYRISKSSWHYADSHPVVKKIRDMVEDLTGLSLRKSEELQIQNYGIGGYYDVHYDYATKNQLKHSTFNENGNRIATVLIYMTDVELGGDTVFPRLGVRVRPKKGSVLFWRNLHPDGTGVATTRHIACPVIYGTKWVANHWIRMGGQNREKSNLLPENGI